MCTPRSCGGDAASAVRGLPLSLSLPLHRSGGATIWSLSGPASVERARRAAAERTGRARGACSDILLLHWISPSLAFPARRGRSLAGMIPLSVSSIDFRPTPNAADANEVVVTTDRKERQDRPAIYTVGGRREVYVEALYDTRCRCGPRTLSASSNPGCSARDGARSHEEAARAAPPASSRSR